MPKPSKHKLHLKKVQDLLARKRKLNQCQESVNETMNNMNNSNKQELKIMHNTTSDVSNVANSNPPSIYNMITNTLKDMPENDLKLVSHFLHTIKYSYGKNKDRIISPYLQKKAFNYISNSLYKPGNSHELLNNQNKQLKKSIKKLQKSKDCMTHKVRAVAKRRSELKDNDLRTIIRNLIKQNKKEYNTDFVKLTIQVSQIGQISFNTAAESIKTVFNFLTGNNTES
ncbi:5561_t:CDS:2 [Cetraspora pellucida]|uniref:5561_t:CDS:1 n=1 Tax=Cetraspora pellucida TaxID=1433469 RepID=A0A9N9AVN9_9GLOM|nr:5561_t:CDS:2 [Cetraspora pellucida]